MDLKELSRLFNVYSHKYKFGNHVYHCEIAKLTVSKR